MARRLRGWRKLAGSAWLTSGLNLGLCRLGPGSFGPPASSPDVAAPHAAPHRETEEAPG